MSDIDLTPGNFHIAGAKVFVNGQNIGSLNQDGAVFTYTPDVHLHMSAKFGSTPVAATVIGVEVTAELNIGETTKENMELVMAGIATSGERLVMGGVVGAQMAGVELLLVPFDDTESILLKNAVSTDPIEVSYSPSGERVYVAKFTGMIDSTSDTVGEIGEDVS